MNAPFSLSECVKKQATQRSTQESDQIDEVNVNSLVSKLKQSHALDVFFSVVKTARNDDDSKRDIVHDKPAAKEHIAPSLVDCRTFESLLKKYSSSTGEERAGE